MVLMCTYLPSIAYNLFKQGLHSVVLTTLIEYIYPMTRVRFIANYKRVNGCTEVWLFMVKLFLQFCGQFGLPTGWNCSYCDHAITPVAHTIIPG